MEKTAYEIGVLLALENVGLLEKNADSRVLALGGIDRGAKSLTRGLRGGMGQASIKPRLLHNRPAGQTTFQGQRTPGTVPGRSHIGATPRAQSYSRRT